VSCSGLERKRPAIRRAAALTGLVGKLAPSSLGLRLFCLTLSAVQLGSSVSQRAAQGPVFGFFAKADSDSNRPGLGKRELRSDSGHLRFPLSDRIADSCTLPAESSS
jgi:hypothetical protein